VTKQDEENMMNLWNLGHGSGSIAIKLKIKEALVRKFLKDNNLKRTITESRNLRRKAGIPYYVKDGPQEILPTKEEVLAAIDSTENVPQAAYKLGVTVWKFQKLKRMYVIRDSSYKSASIYENMDTADGLSKADLERAVRL